MKTKNSIIFNGTISEIKAELIKTLNEIYSNYSDLNVEVKIDYECIHRKYAPGEQHKEAKVTKIIFGREI